jgi:hypothetical protein
MKYYHHRIKDDDGQPFVKGGLTFAYEIEEGRCFYTFARCSRKDNFCKRIGRKIAEGRFDKRLAEGTVPSFFVVGHDIIEQILGHYANS